MREDQKANRTDIQWKKSSGYNIYGVRDSVFDKLAALTAALMITGLIQILTLELPRWLGLISFAIVFACASGIVRLLRGKREEKVEEYQRTAGFEFIGLYDLSKGHDLGTRDIIPREAEADYLNQMLQSLIFRQNTVKQAVCLTGESGCGKSTILSFFRQKYGRQYTIYDFTGDYKGFSAKVHEVFGQNVERQIAEHTQVQKLVIILDQFERYFFLDKVQRESVRVAILSLNCRNTALILSLRQEYLTDFLKEFDINNMQHSGGRGAVAGESGILNNLTTVIRDDRKNYHVQKDRFALEIADWKGEPVRQAAHVHLEHPAGYGEVTALEPVGSTIFFCENQNDVKIRTGGSEQEASILQSRCESLFGKEGRAFYEKHRHEPLIEQQIFYHMAEYDKKIRELSPDDLHEFFEKEDHELLAQYFDTQLAATDDYFNASRILYLLSSVRMNHVAMSREDLEAGLFAQQFSEEGHIDLAQTIRRLEELQLIRRSSSHSDQEYEIAHDFIAQSFLTYAHTNMSRSAKGALDIYIAEFLDPNRESYLEKKRMRIRKAQKSTFYRHVWLILAAAALALDIAMHFNNPWWWSTTLRWYNPYIEVHPFVIIVYMELSMLYIYQFYEKVLRFCSRKKVGLCRVIYVIVMLLAFLGIAVYPYAIMLFGLGQTLLGVNCAIVLAGSDQNASRTEMRNFGLKCMLLGIGFMVLHPILLKVDRWFDPLFIFIEMAMLFMLLA